MHSRLPCCHAAAAPCRCACWLPAARQQLLPCGTWGKAVLRRSGCRPALGSAAAPPPTPPTPNFPRMSSRCTHAWRAPAAGDQPCGRCHQCRPGRPAWAALLPAGAAALPKPDAGAGLVPGAWLGGGCRGLRGWAGRQASGLQRADLPGPLLPSLCGAAGQESAAPAPAALQAFALTGPLLLSAALESMWLRRGANKLFSSRYEQDGVGAWTD